MSQQSHREKSLDTNSWTPDVSVSEVPPMSQEKQPRNKSQMNSLVDRTPITDNIWNQYMPPVSIREFLSFDTERYLILNSFLVMEWLNLKTLEVC